MNQQGDVLIRDYRPEDYPELVNLWEVTGLSTKGRGDNHHTIMNTLAADGRLLILCFRGKLVGSSWITSDGRRLYLHHFGILPEFQGKKLAHPLLKASLNIAKEQNMQIKLEVHRENLIANRLYQKYGFAPLGNYDVYIIRNPGEIDL